MDPPLSRFRDEFVRYLDNEVLPKLGGESEVYWDLEVRPLGQERIQIRNLRFIRKNLDGDLELVNGDLASDSLVFEFHFDDVGSWSEWSGLLVAMSITTNCQHLETPYALKWERAGSLGRLKADERFDTDRVYIRDRIGPKNAIRPGLDVMLHEYLPSDIEQLARTSEIPLVIKRVFEEDSEVIDGLKRTEI